MGKEMTNRHQPVILTEGSYGMAELTKLKQQPLWRIVDIRERQLHDLFEIQHPGNADTADLQNFVATNTGDHPELKGDWIYFPWSGILLHAVSQAEQYQLRTNRNHSLITSAEQERLANAVVAIAGLSVGGGIATGLAYAGTASQLNLADFDLLETPNLNRVQAALAEVGQPKAEITAQRIWEISPYTNLSLFPQGISRDNLASFLGGSSPVNLVFDEIDDFEMKVLIRREAKRMNIPVAMMTALGDSVLIDIERYDTQPDTKVFNGLIGELENEILTNEITEEAKKRYAAQIIGIENVPTRAIESLLEIGQSLVGRPQLGGTVAVEGGLAIFVARQILLANPLASGRYRISFNEIVRLTDENIDSPARREAIGRLMARR